MPFPWLPVLSTVAQFGNSLLQSNQSKQNVNRTTQGNLELAKYEHSKNLEMWNLNNAYNSPEAQMERLRKAGLNPNMVYGSGKVAGNTSGEFPKYNAPTVDHSGVVAPRIPDMINMYQDVELKNAQIDNAKLVADQKRLENAFLNSSLGARVTRERSKSLRESYEYQKSSKDLTLKDLQIEMTQKKIEEKDYDLIFKKYRNEWMQEGFTSSDNVAFRMLVRMMQESGIDLLNEDEVKRILNKSK